MRHLRSNIADESNRQWSRNFGINPKEGLPQFIVADKGINSNNKFYKLENSGVRQLKYLEVRR